MGANAAGFKISPANRQPDYLVVREKVFKLLKLLVFLVKC